jgi:hypothetical protein
VGEEDFELSLLDGLSVARCRQDFVRGFTQHRSTAGRAVCRPTDTRCRADQRRNNILCEQREHAGNDQLPFRTSRFGRAKPCQIALQFHLVLFPQLVNICPTRPIRAYIMLTSCDRKPNWRFGSIDTLALINNSTPPVFRLAAILSNSR